MGKQSNAPMGKVVQDIEGAEAPSVVERITHEVRQPDLVEGLPQAQRHPLASGQCRASHLFLRICSHYSRTQALRHIMFGPFLKVLKGRQCLTHLLPLAFGHT